MRKLLALITAVLLVATACSSGSPTATQGSDDPDVDLDDNDVRLVGRLIPFENCSSLLSHLQAEASERVGPYGLDYYGMGWGWFGDDVAVLEEEPAEEAALEPAVGGAFDDDASFDTASNESAAATGGDGGGAGGEFTGTNVQELGVDEPDIIKTDGDRIIVVAENTLTYVDLTGGEPVVTDEISLSEGWGHELFFEDDRALLFSNGDWWGGPIPVEPFDAPAVEAVEADAEAAFAHGSDTTGEAAFESEPRWYGPSATITEIDLSDPDDLEISATLSIQGEYLSARRVGDTVRLALTSPPTQLEWVYPSSPAGEDRAERFNRELIGETTIEDWIPQYELTIDDETSDGPLLDCDRLHRPAEFAGFDVVSVLSFGLDDGIDAGDGAGVLASGRTVYASPDRFYVATTKWAGAELTADDGWREWSEDYTTDIHAFSISTNEPADYVASGTVGGSLLNQFSLDEHDGYLRVITTDGSPWSETGQSETVLTVFDEDGDLLTAVGSVGGLGRGESLYSARLLDDVGFAVTFRQIDPFYVLDLRDPTDPRVTGELKIPGVSTYLHPVSETLVLWVGQDATEEGRTTGLKVSLFDVSDPSDPREVDVWTMPDGYSPAEDDHRAFQFLAENRIAIVPAQTWTQDFNGAVLLEIGDEAIEEVGRITHVSETSEPTTDCEPLDAELFSENTELFWMAQQGNVQFCDAGDNGGYGDWYCDPIPLDDIRYWGPEDEMEAVIAQLTDGEPGPEHRIELCWPDGGEWRRQIQRSIVVGADLWTFSWDQLQANELDSLEIRAVLTL